MQTGTVSQTCGSRDARWDAVGSLIAGAMGLSLGPRPFPSRLRPMLIVNVSDMKSKRRGLAMVNTPRTPAL